MKIKLAAVLVFVGAAITFGIVLSQGSSHMALDKQFPPEKLFPGPQLPLAQAIAHSNYVQAIKAIPGTDINKPGTTGLSLLGYAFRAAVPDQNHPQADSFRIMSALVKAGADPDYAVNKDAPSPVSVAIEATSPHFMIALLKGGMDPNFKYGEYKTPIIYDVAGEGSLATLQALIQAGADPDASGGSGETPTMEAFYHEDLDNMEYLFRHGAKVDAVDRSGISVPWLIWKELNRTTKPETKKKLEEIRDVLIAKGVTWPPESPKVVRKQMREHGIEPEGPAALDEMER